MLKVVASNQASLLQTVQTYQGIRHQIAELEEKLRPLKDELETAASQTPDGRLVIEHYKVTLSIAQRESVKLKDAKAALGDKLNPFISVTPYTVLRVS